MSLSLQPVQWVGQTWLSKDTCQLNRKFFLLFPATYRPGVRRSIPQAKPRAENTPGKAGNRYGSGMCWERVNLRTQQQ